MKISLKKQMFEMEQFFFFFFLSIMELLFCNWQMADQQKKGQELSQNSKLQSNWLGV